MEQEQNLNNLEDSVDYIDAIKKLKETTVDKDTYQKLKEENKKLIDSLVSGQTPEEFKATPEAKSIEELRSALFNGDLNNLEYAKTSLELRDALIQSGQPDPFIPTGRQIAPTEEDISCAERVAEGMKSCIEYADGNSEIFTNELQRITIDTGRMPGRR